MRHATRLTPRRPGRVRARDAAALSCAAPFSPRFRRALSPLSFVAPSRYRHHCTAVPAAGRCCKPLVVIRARLLFPSSASVLPPRGPRRILAALLCLAALTTAHAEAPPGCEVYWQLTPQWSDSGTRLQVRTATASGDAGSRDWQPAADNPSLMAGASHFVALAQAVLPLPPALAARPHLQMCVRVEGLDDTQVLASNLHAEPAGPDRLLRWQGSPALLRELVLAAGSLQQRERTAGGLHLRLLLAPGLVDRAEPLADEALDTLAAQRRFWRSSEPARTMLLLHADDRGGAPAALARSRALVLRAPSAAFAPGAAFRLQLARADLRGWFRERFGPTIYEHQPDEATSAWFVEGFSLFYALRQAAADDGWPLDDFAAALSGLWQQESAPATAPWLALQWHTALRRRGGSGLDAALRRLLLPAPQARAAGRLSSPLAGHRLFAALRPQLGDEPRQAVQRLSGSMAVLPADLATDTFGPCFTVLPAERRVQPADPSPSPDCRAWLGATEPEAADGAALPAQSAKGPGARSKAAKARPKGKRAAAPPKSSLEAKPKQRQAR